MALCSANVSVVIPTYGREHVLLDTLRQLMLGVRSLEVLVVDQTECPESVAVTALRQLESDQSIRWIRHRPPGMVGALNRGLMEARGEIILFLDDDIIPSPKLIEAHRLAYEHHPDAWAVVGQVLQPEDGRGMSECGKLKAEVRLEKAGGTKPQLSGFIPHPFLCRDLDFNFNGATPTWVENVMSGNLSVRRERALALGGFDAHFIPPVSYRFETEFARRLIAAGGRIRFEPSASIRHLRAARGGTRTLGCHLKSPSPLHGVGDYYYALRCGQGWDRCRYLIRRPFREICTRFHFRHPWWMPVKFIGELRAISMAVRLYAKSCRQIPPL